MATEYAYIGRDNTIDVQLQDDTAVPGTMANTSLAAATMVEIIIDYLTKYDSVNNPTVVWFETSGVVHIALGSVLTPEQANTKIKVEIVVYDNLNDDGVAWQPRLTVKVLESEPA